MTKEEAIQLLARKQVKVWNLYRERHPNWVPDLRGADLSEFYLWNVNLAQADLRGASLPVGLHLYDLDSLGRTRQQVILKDALVDVNTTVADNTDLGHFGVIFCSESGFESDRASLTAKIFISYAWANEEVVLAIDQWLRLKGLNTKIDKRDFFAGSRIRDEIMRLMQECEVVLIFHSQQSKDKPWPQFERELASDLEMAAKQSGKNPPRIIYIVIDNTPLPSVSEANRIAIMVQGKRFELVCEEIYQHILQIPRVAQEIDLSKWSNYIF